MPKNNNAAEQNGYNPNQHESFSDQDNTKLYKPRIALNDTNDTKKFPTKEHQEDARKYTKNKDYFKEPLRKSTFWQRLGGFFTGKSKEIKEKDKIIDTIRGQIADNITNNTNWHNGVIDSLEKLNVSNKLKEDFCTQLNEAKKIAMKKDKTNYHNIILPSLNATQTPEHSKSITPPTTTASNSKKHISSNHR